MKILDISEGIITFQITRRNGESHLCYISQEDEALLLGHTWCLTGSPRSKTLYLRTWMGIYRDRKAVKLHRVVCPGNIVDHIDGNGLNNCRDNLRAVTASESQWNKPRYSSNKSGYIGVVKSTDGRGWVAKIGMAGGKKYIGAYKCPILAALAYDREAHMLRGEFARYNFPGLIS